MPDPASKCVLFPSPEYLEAGNFRLPPQTAKLIGGAFSIQAYREFYDAKMKELDVSPLNFASIAMVCNIKSE